jgi:hypothetical protein
MVNDGLEMRWRPVLAVLVAVLMAGCHNPTSINNNTVENLAGVVKPGMAASNNFNVTNAGEVQITLQSLTPGGAVYLAAAYGQPNAGVCQPVNWQVIGSTYVGKTVFDFPVYAAGQYCMLTADCALVPQVCALPGLTVAQTYSYQVSHP